VINMDDWFLVWFGLEVNMIRFILIIYSRERIIRIESCIKYFFVQRLGSVFIISQFYLNKISYLYGGRLILRYKIGGGPFFLLVSYCL